MPKRRVIKTANNMQKINFKNKGEEGYESSKLNADNLNLLQTNVEGN